LSALHWAILPLRRYAQFRGRSRRAEFWWFRLALGAVQLALLAFGARQMWSGAGYWGAAAQGNELTSAISTILSFATLVPSLAVTVRRLHDTDRSGWWWFLVLIPLFGWLVLFIFLVQDGTPGSNRHGPDPKGRGLDDLREVFR
jgi:uncharacterized membrane protein YhaH (DUF805 family)